MKSEIIGDPKIFAIEFTVEFVKVETVYGTCRIWIEGKTLGDIYEGAYLGIACEEIQEPVKLHYRDYDGVDSVIPDISSSPLEFIKMLEDENENWASVFNYEPFDKFRKTYYWKGEKFIFYWCLSPRVTEDIETYPQFKNYPEEVQRAEVQTLMMKQITDEFKAKIEKLKKENKA